MLLEGVPEECIAQYIEENRSVRLIIMGTRAAKQKAHDLAGSITAEVLDSSRIQALTVPEGDSWFNSLSDVKHVSLLSTLEQDNPDLIVVPNRKKNMLLRFFNPGLAHRILFHTDIPMMVIPV